MKTTDYQMKESITSEFETGIEEIRVGFDVYEAFVIYCPECQSGHLHKRDGCMCCTRCTYTKC